MSQQGQKAGSGRKSSGVSGGGKKEHLAEAEGRAGQGANRNLHSAKLSCLVFRSPQTSCRVPVKMSRLQGGWEQAGKTQAVTGKAVHTREKGPWTSWAGRGGGGRLNGFCFF